MDSQKNAMHNMGKRQKGQKRKQNITTISDASMLSILEKKKAQKHAGINICIFRSKMFLFF